MSPYLFTICMNVLSCLLNSKPVRFKHHWKCKELGITHLFFADDVLFFSSANKASVEHIMKCISQFSEWSGLKPSVHKSTSFLCNCTDDFTSWFDNEYAIPRGSLPVRFLGVPLISKQLCINDCMPLISKITGRITSWTNLLLSFAGRVLLIKSVLCAIEAYWCNHFILPSLVHKEIQSLLTRFLWKGNINNKGGAKVAWDVVCLPRVEGGLGVKNMVDWNRAQILMHLLRVVSKSTSLWATWVNATLLKHGNFWTVVMPTDASWTWKKVLKLRVVALQFISYNIGNGRSMSLWFEPWRGGGCLALNKHSSIIRQCGMSSGATVGDLLSSSGWVLPVPNSRLNHLDPLLVHWLATFNYPSFNLESRDYILWDGNDINKVKTWHVWESIRRRGEPVPWFGDVWHKLQINRYAHHLWLVCHGRLNTSARLARFGILISQQCYLCVSGKETDNHLFLHCHYSSYILIRLLHLLGLRVAGDSWLQVLQGILSIIDKAKGRIALCMLQVFCYQVWRERNARAHYKGCFGPLKLLDCILVDVRARLSSSTWFCNIRCSRPDLVF